MRERIKSMKDNEKNDIEWEIKCNYKGSMLKKCSVIVSNICITQIDAITA